MEDYINYLKNFFRMEHHEPLMANPIAQKALAILGFCLAILGMWILINYGKGTQFWRSFFRLTDQGELLLPWQSVNDEAFRIPGICCDGSIHVIVRQDEED
jgi:hypothetical protein